MSLLTALTLLSNKPLGLISCVYNFIAFVKSCHFKLLITWRWGRKLLISFIELMLTLLKQNMNLSSNDILRKIEQLEKNVKLIPVFFCKVFLGCSFFQIIQIQNYLVIFKVMFYFIILKSLLSTDTIYNFNMWIISPTLLACILYSFWSTGQFSFPFTLSKFEMCLHIWDLKITGRRKVINKMPFCSAVFNESDVISKTIRWHI